MYLNIYLCHLSLSVVHSSLISRAIIYFLTVYLNLYLCHLSLSVVHSSLITRAIIYFLSVYLNLYLCHLSLSVVHSSLISRAIIYFLTVDLNLYLCHLSLSVVHSSLISRLSYTFCLCASISTSVISPYQWSIPHWSSGYHMLSDSVPQSLPLSSLPISGPFLTESVVHSSLISRLSYTFCPCTSISTSVFLQSSSLPSSLTVLTFSVSSLLPRARTIPTFS